LPGRVFRIHHCQKRLEPVRVSPNRLQVIQQPEF
jgi:hypothetical protein